MEGRLVAFLFINVNHDVGYESSESIPISLGYILAGLKADGSDGIILDDLRDRPLALKGVEKWVRRLNPKVVGFTAYQSTMNRIRFLSRYLKSRHPNITIVLGGPQVMMMPSDALHDLHDIDVLIRGEGEIAARDISRALAAGLDLNQVPGITLRSDGRIVDTGSGSEPPEDLDTYPSPYLTGLLNLDGKNTAILLSSRGCNHVCWFCITPLVCRGKIRYHSIERVLAEMELLSSQGIERFWFADPNFTENRQRVEQLLEQKMRRGIQTPFWCQTRGDLVDAELLKLLKSAGADTIAFGLESGSPGILQKTHKGIELEQLRGNVATAQELGLETELFSIFGLPDETVEDARGTITFVQSLGIPIESNSGSQQMQLYFGSLYEKTPERFGISPLPGYRPRYRSVGDDYRTAGMARADMRKVRNLWALSNEQLKRDVYYKQRTFEVLDFLLENRSDLEEEPTYHAYGALASASIEEFSLLLQFLKGYARATEEEDTPVEELISALGFFQETEEPSGSMDRVIFDSRSYIGGVPFTGISGKYWDVLLGRGLLLPDFEAGLVGVVRGEEPKFSFVFPDDYHQVELQGKEVEVQARVHKVLQTVEAGTIEEVEELKIKNRYDFHDLNLLRDQNEILYYLALRDSSPEELLKTPSHFLMLTHRLAKLGKRAEIEKIARLLDGKPTALNALADTLVGAGKFAWAIPYYEALSEAIPSAVVKRARCLLNMEQPKEALALIETIPDSPELEFRETLLECLKAAAPNSIRIPGLARQVMDLRVKAVLARETMPRSGQTFPEAMAHGIEEED